MIKHHGVMNFVKGCGVYYDSIFEDTMLVPCLPFLNMNPILYGGILVFPKLFPILSLVLSGKSGKGVWFRERNREKGKNSMVVGAFQYRRYHLNNIITLIAKNRRMVKIMDESVFVSQIFV